MGHNGRKVNQSVSGSTDRLLFSPRLYRYFVCLSKTLSALLQSTKLANQHHMEHPCKGCLFRTMSSLEKIVLSNVCICPERLKRKAYVVGIMQFSSE